MQFWLAHLVRLQSDVSQDCRHPKVQLGLEGLVPVWLIRVTNESMLALDGRPLLLSTWTFCRAT